MVLNNIIFSLIGPKIFTKSESYQNTGIFPELFDDPELGKIYHGTVQLILKDDLANRETFYREVTFLYQNTIVQQIPVSPNKWEEFNNMYFDRIEIRNGYDSLNQELEGTPSGRFELNFEGDMLYNPNTYQYLSKTTINDSLPALVSISGTVTNYGGGAINFYDYDWENDQVGNQVVFVDNLQAPNYEFVIGDIPSNKGYIATINGEPALVNGDKFFFTNTEDYNLEISLAPDENFVPFDLPAANNSLTENVDVQVDYSRYREDVLQVFTIDNTTGEEIFVAQAMPVAATIFSFSLTPNTAYVFRNRSKKLSVDSQPFLFTNQQPINVNLA